MRRDGIESGELKGEILEVMKIAMNFPGASPLHLAQTFPLSSAAISSFW